VVLDGPGGQEQLGTDLPIGQPVAGQPRDLGLLSGQLVAARCGGAPTGGLAGGPQLAAGPFGECLHADRVEHGVRGAQLLARLGPAALTAQPLAVQQVRASQLGPKLRAAQPVNRLAIPVLSIRAVADQRPAARVDPGPPVGLPDAGGLGQPAERGGGHLALPGPAGRLDQFGQRLPQAVFDGWQDQVATNRARFYRDLPAGPFYGYNRPGAEASEAIIENWWRQAMTGGAKAHYDGIAAFSQTDFTADLTQITVPVLVMHGDDDQVVPYADSGPRTAALVKNGTLKTYNGYSHGMPTTHADVINADLLAWLQA
jgi:hypothetical protein